MLRSFSEVKPSLSIPQQKLAETTVTNNFAIVQWKIERVLPSLQQHMHAK